MPKMKKVGPTRGFGPRYGATVRKRYNKVVAGLKKSHRCPNCGFVKVKRESVGVWKCKKCNYTYTGGAYMPATKLGIIAKRAAKGAPIEETTKEAAKPAEETETAQ
jgi:large subunit ribosomal protein L37Ae